MSTGRESWEQREARERAEGQAALARACEVLGLLGVQTVRVGYDGSGDEGMIQETYYEPHPPAGLPEGLGGLLEKYVYSHLPAGWEIDGGSHGTVTINVLSAEAENDHHWREEDEFWDEDSDDEWE